MSPSYRNFQHHWRLRRLDHVRETMLDDGAYWHMTACLARDRNVLQHAALQPHRGVIPLYALGIEPGRADARISPSVAHALSNPSEFLEHGTPFRRGRLFTSRTRPPEQWWELFLHEEPTLRRVDVQAHTVLRKLDDYNDDKTVETQLF